MQEIAMNILDIVYNSIKAKAKLIKILIIDSILENVISVEIIDDGCGMDEATVEKVTSPFYTTRTTRKVGLGVPLFKENVEATGGHFLIESEPGKGTRIMGSFVKDHLDTPPMGDIIATMVTLLQANADIDYLFKYRTDENEFVLDTKEVKQMLDGVPINEPEIIIWLKDYMKEGINL